jgi:hypothetical protein
MFRLPTDISSLKNVSKTVSQKILSEDLKWGFDLTDIKASDWRKICAELNLTNYRGDQLDSGHENGWVWMNDDGLRIITKNDPITGNYYGGGRESEKDYASYIGIEGPDALVKKAVSLIKKYGDSKGESPNKREFI